MAKNIKEYLIKNNLFIILITLCLIFIKPLVSIILSTYQLAIGQIVLEPMEDYDSIINTINVVVMILLTIQIFNISKMTYKKDADRERIEKLNLIYRDLAFYKAYSIDLNVTISNHFLKESKELEKDFDYMRVIGYIYELVEKKKNYELEYSMYKSTEMIYPSQYALGITEKNIIDIYETKQTHYIDFIYDRIKELSNILLKNCDVMLGIVEAEYDDILNDNNEGIEKIKKTLDVKVQEIEDSYISETEILINKNQKFRAYNKK